MSTNLNQRPANRAAHGNSAQAEHQSPAGGVRANFMLFHAMPSVLTSMIFHAAALVLMALMFVVIDDPTVVSEFVMGREQKEDVQDIREITPVEFNKPVIDPNPDQMVPPQPVEVQLESHVDEPDVSPVDELEAGAVTVDTFDPLGASSLRKHEMLTAEGAYDGPLTGRGTPTDRKRLARISGGTDDSEAAVALALRWIVSRQSRDGGWNFDHNQSIHPQPCPDPGSAAAARNGATALALLPLLGAGQTHQQGEYQRQVRAGLAYLIENMRVSGATGSWHESGGSMYSHGLAAIAMCEAYAMTHDKNLLEPAQRSINFIAYAQDPVGGGWRYQPKQAGDTSAVGWQLMALKSGHMAYLQVPQSSVLGATKFLDSVQADSGAQYGYTHPAEGRRATSAVGLLCRMYLGWKRDNPGLQRGIAIFDRAGPSTSDMYYNYYATQVCRHHEGEVWERWNARMRDWLVKSQEREGVKAGSWWMPGGGHANERGGRLYCTAMATLMLEVYYRHLPIYRQQAAEDDFQL